MFDLQTAKLKQSTISHRASTRLQVAERENRAMTEEETKDHETDLKALDDLGKRIGERESDDNMRSAIDEKLGLPAGDGTSRVALARFREVKSLARQYIESDAFKWFKATKETRSGRWESPTVEIEYRALLSEDPASGGALVVPDYQPGIVSGPVLRLVVADLFAPGTTDSNSVSSQVESEFTNAAAPVLEGAAKPESTLSFETKPEPVRKLAHWIPVTEEMLEDAPQIRSYIDTRLKYGVLRKEEQQLLFGTGVAPQLEGVLVRPGLAPDVVRVDPATSADAILTQIVRIESATGYPVSGIVMNPLAWGAIIGAKDTQGRYLSAGAPFVSPSGTPMLWGRDVALTDQMTATTALVGAFKKGGQVFRRGGVKVNASNSHEDFFVTNRVAIRAEERLALAIYRPDSFGKVTMLTNVAPAAALDLEEPPAKRR